MRLDLYLFLLFFFISNALHSSIIYVNQQSDCDSSDGSNWALAFCDLEEALAVAEYGDTIWIAAGTYYPTDGINRDTAFHLVSGVAIFGGFEGIETNLSERDWENNLTILSGEIGDTSMLWDNSFHIIQAENLDSTTVLDGVIIEKGYGADPQNFLLENQIGGGLNNIVNTPNQRSWLRLENVTMRNNYARGDNTAKRNGGGAISNQVLAGSLNIVFNNCHFENNKGKIPVMNTRIKDMTGIVDIKIFDSHFIENTEIILPFMIYNGVDSSQFNLQIENSVFDGNDGNIMNESYGGDLSVIINNSIFLNSLSHVFDAIVTESNASIEIVIDSCAFMNNQDNVLSLDLNPVALNFDSTKFNVEIKNSQYLNNNSILNLIRGAADSVYMSLENCIFDSNTSSGSLNIFNSELFNNANSISFKSIKLRFRSFENQKERFGY